MIFWHELESWCLGFRWILALWKILFWLVVWNMIFIFPNSWDDDPIWRTHIFQGRWNHQLVLLIGHDREVYYMFDGSLEFEIFVWTWRAKEMRTTVSLFSGKVGQGKYLALFLACSRLFDHLSLALNHCGVEASELPSFDTANRSRSPL